MDKFNEVEGNLITLAKEGKFDVITHGCNCFCVMGAGIAPQMALNFDCDEFPLENAEYFQGDMNKLGQIDYEVTLVNDKPLAVVNSYTQYGFGKNHTEGSESPVDYEAITLCMKKINHQFKGKHIGLPLIGCGLAGGDWNIVKEIIKKELKDCDITVVHFKAK